MENCYLREITQQDMKLLYDWANDPAVRESAFNSHKISWQDHEQWFLSKFESNDCDIFIMHLNNIPIGQIRLEYFKNRAIIDYSIAAPYRGQGYGRKMLCLAEEMICNKHKEIDVMEAEVKLNNVASRRKFEELGYESVELVRYRKVLGKSAKR